MLGLQTPYIIMLVGVAVIGVLGYFLLLHRSCRATGGLVELQADAEERWKREQQRAEARVVRVVYAALLSWLLPLRDPA